MEKNRGIMEFYFDTEARCFKLLKDTNDSFHLDILNRLLTDFAAPLMTPEALLDQLEMIDDPYKGNSDFLYYLIAQIRDHQIDVPALPDTTARLLNLLSEDEVPFTVFADVIRRDALIAAKIIRLANSSFYRGTQQIDSVEQAIGRIGLKTLKEIALAISLENVVFESESSRKFATQEWGVSIYTASIAARLGGLVDGALSPETLYTIGLLHNIGSFMILAIFDRYLSSEKGLAMPDHTFVYHLIEAFQYQISLIVLREWAFPDEVLKPIHALEEGERGLTGVNSKILFLATKLAFLGCKNQITELSSVPFHQGIIAVAGLEIDPEFTTLMIQEVQEEIQSFMDLEN